MEQLQSLFAPIVAVLGGAALLLLWRYNRNIRYLPYFALGLFSFAIAIVLSQVVFPKMTVANALSNSIFYFATGGFMVHAALMRIGKKLNLKLHLFLMSFDILARLFILNMGYSSGVYLIFVNTILSVPLAIGAYILFNHKPRDPQSTALACAYGFIVFVSVCITPIAISIGDQLTSENFFFSLYWILLSILTVVGIFIIITAYGFTVASDLLRNAEANGQKLNETIHDLRQPLHALRLKLHGLMLAGEKGEPGLEDMKRTFGYLEDLMSSHLDQPKNKTAINTNDHMTSNAVLAGVYNMFIEDAEAKNLTLHHKSSDLEVNIEALELMRIASNLVSNAIKYTDQGSVTFGLFERDGHIQLEVSDTGIGMSTQEFKAALTRSVRLKKSATKTTGNGYGLAIVKQIADEHSLTLSLDEHNNVGTRVVVGFPSEASPHTTNMHNLEVY